MTKYVAFCNKCGYMDSVDAADERAAKLSAKYSHINHNLRTGRRCDYDFLVKRVPNRAEIQSGSIDIYSYSTAQFRDRAPEVTDYSPYRITQVNVLGS